MPSSNHNRWLIYLLTFALANLLLFNLLLPRLWPAYFSNAPAFYLEQWSQAIGVHKGQGDSWTPMTAAFRHTQSDSDTPVYTAVFFQQNIKFQYPPMSLLLMWPVNQFPPDEYPFWVINGLNAISWWCILLTPLICTAIFALSWHKRLPHGRTLWLFLPLITLLALTYYPNLRAYHLGQIQIWLNAAAALLILAWLRGWRQTAGLLVGFMCLIKPQYGLIFIWALLRRQWHFARAATIAGLGGVMASLALFGLQNHLDYLPAVSFMSRHGEVFHPNQSINGLLNRWFLTGPILSFTPETFAIYHPIVYWGTLLTSLILILLCLFYPWRIPPAKQATTADLAIALLTSTLASPIAWEHHYGVLLPIYALFTPYLIKHPIWKRATLPLLALSYFLTSNDIILFHPLAQTHWNILLSLLLFGAMALLATLYRWRQANQFPA